ncbi:hypothetical protein C5473_19485 [Leptospira interrogans serovar Weerasinghe]|nr:hypothetical protein C5473_19485 [Leptospira interrogans serovar Weerasinghe]
MLIKTNKIYLFLKNFSRPNLLISYVIKNLILVLVNIYYITTTYLRLNVKISYHKNFLIPYPLNKSDSDFESFCQLRSFRKCFLYIIS